MRSKKQFVYTVNVTNMTNEILIIPGAYGSTVVVAET